MRKAPLYIILSLLLLSATLSCKKFLDAKPDQALHTPSTLNDLQRLLDNYGTMNTGYAAMHEILSDNYYLSTADWSSLFSTSEKNGYIWEKDDEFISEWSQHYRMVFWSNIVLDNLKLISRNDNQTDTYNSIKGGALFYRGAAFYSLAQLFAPPLSESTASTPYGIPLRLDSDFTTPSVRSTVHETWQQIVKDYKEAAALLPEQQQYINRPSRLAACAALARTYLAMSDYENALKYADSALAIKNDLINFNALSTTSAIPIPRFNTEVIIPLLSYGSTVLHPSRAKIDSTLFNMYHNDDLRKTIFFKSNGNNTYAPKANYDGSNTGALFQGLTTSELYLVKAECQARLGDHTGAMNTLNQLLITRWKDGSFIPFTAPDAETALEIILTERRKELVFRGQRWTDLRRLNLVPSTAITLYRHVNNQVYELLPNSNGYTLQIPLQVIELSGMHQNP